MENSVEFKKELKEVLKKLGYSYEDGSWTSPCGYWNVDLQEFTVARPDGSHSMIGSVEDLLDAVAYESNNSWFKIEKYSDLPTNMAGRTFVYTNKGKIYHYSQYTQWFSISETEEVTHYQIVELEPPLV